jgi:DNA-binding CsgD family transcriptional regulator
VTAADPMVVGCLHPGVRPTVSGVVDPRTVERARAGINRLVGLDAPWTVLAAEVIGQLRRVIAFDCFCASQNDPLALMPATAVADNDVISNQQQRFWQIEMQLPDVNKTCHLVTAPTPVAVLSTATGGDLARSLRWDELLGPGGLGDELRAALVADGQWWGSLSLYRERRSARFTAADADALARLTPPIAALARASWTASPQNPTAVEPGPGTIVVRNDGVPVSATPAAEAWLARLHTSLRAKGTLIYAMCARLGATSGPYAPTDSVRSLVRGMDGGWIEFDAGRLRSALGSGAIAITVQRARPDAVAELLTRAYALTPRERQVAELARAGRSTAEIGAELFLSRHTVADHLKAIFAKTRVHARHELVERLAGQPT